MDRDIVLIVRGDGALLPVYRDALGVAEGWPWKIKNLYSNALVIFHSQEAMCVAEVIVFGPAGSSTFSKLFSIFNLNWNIELKYSKLPLDLFEIVNFVCGGLRANAERRMNLFDVPNEVLIQRVRAASSLSELFDALGVNNLNKEFEALDSL